MELIIFDVDGTLVYSDRRDSRCFAQAYEQIYEQPFPSLDWSTFPHVTDTTIFDTVIRQHFGRVSEPEEVERFQSRYMELLRENRRLRPHLFCEVPGARAAVQLLESAGRIIGVGTGGWQQPAFIKLDHVGIKIRRQLFTGADGKVNREAIVQQTIDRATEMNGAPPTRVVYIGDAVWDVATTYNMQIDFIGVRRLGDKDVLEEAGASVVIRDYQDTAAFEQALKQAEPPRKAEKNAARDRNNDAG